MKTIGYFDEFLHPRVRLIVKGLRKSLRIDPIIDTGFDGYLCLPVKTAVQLGLELYGESRVELADGSKKNELSFLGSVLWQDQERPARIFLTDSKDALIGNGLFQGQKLSINYVNYVASIAPVAVAKSGEPKKRKPKK